MKSTLLTFDVDALAHRLDQSCPQVVFALLHGSARDGHIGPGSDIDLALYLSGRPDLDLYASVTRVVGQLVPHAECDIGVLNHAEPVYRFEALRGRMLFVRDMQRYLRFFSLTCREYESQMVSYQRQRRYRLDAGRAADSSATTPVRQSALYNPHSR